MIHQFHYSNKQRKKQIRREIQQIKRNVPQKIKLKRSQIIPLNHCSYMMNKNDLMQSVILQTNLEF